LIVDLGGTIVGEPLVTVVVATRNRPQVLSRALDGVKSQRFDDYEVVVMDDGSPDEAACANREMVSSHGKRFSYQYIGSPRSQGSGPSVVRNEAVRQAHGRYLAFCDDDDAWIDFDFLGCAVEELERSGLSLLLGNQRTVRDGTIVSDDWMPAATGRARDLGWGEGGEVYRLARAEVLQRPGYGHLNFTVVRRSLYEGVGGLWEATRFAEDVDLFVRLADRCEEILYRPKPCADHYVPGHGSGSASSRIAVREQRLLEALVYDHCLVSSTSREARHYVALSASTNAKLLCEILKQEGRLPEATLFARRALAACVRPKWAGYTVWLALRGWMGKKRRA